MDKFKIKYKLSWKDFIDNKRRRKDREGLDGFVFWKKDGEDIIVVQVSPNPEVTRILKEKGTPI